MTTRRDKQGRFKKGKSGNPKGRPRVESAELRQRLAEHGPAMADKLVSMAMEGDVQALRICLERLLPPLKATSTPVSLPGAESGAGLGQIARNILNAAVGAQITPDDAQALLHALASAAKAIEVEELERRIAALEESTREQDH